MKPFEKCNDKTILPLVQEWPGFPAFAVAHAKLNPEAFKRRSSDFRNSDHHRLPANIDVGLAPGARVLLENGHAYFSHTVQQPIKVVDLLPALEEQYECARCCMDAFWEVVKKREADW